MCKKLQYTLSYLKEKKAFSQVNYFCMFTGYPRSGHSLLGALMDAHPEIIISHELDVLEQLRKGYNYRQICAMILENSRAYARKGRSWSGYDYEVKGQWQGKFRQLKVIGDKRGGQTSLLLTHHFNLLEQLKSEIAVPLRFIHVVRNPYDNIVTRARQGNELRKEITPEGIRHNINLHFRQAETNLRVINESGCKVLTIRHEELIHHAEKALVSVCDFLELEAPLPWLKACGAIVFSEPKKTRHDFPYPKEMIDEISEKMKSFPFFDGYTFFD